MNDQQQIEALTAEDLGINPHEPEARRIVEETKRGLLRQAKYVSPAGALKLPALLDERRRGHQIPDSAFRTFVSYDRILVWQLTNSDLDDEDKASEHIYMPQVTKANQIERSPRGVIVGAGLQALDELRTNGMDLGHIVWIMHLNPYMIPCGTNLEGKEVGVRACRAGDVIGSEDLELQRRAGEVSIVVVNGRHCIQRKNEEPAAAMLPDMSPDY